ncbi:hypothetical protein HYT59_00560 [Candidatus Woesebacteria bacterium]|nr:hypothetical protein [Candidatus Woesebacteria bacterium]
MTILRQISAIKKADLHRHVEGATSPRTLWTIYQKRCGGKKTLADFKKRLVLEKDPGKLDSFLKKLATPLLKKYIKEPSDLLFIFEKAVEDAAGDNVTHLELRFTLSNFLALDVSPESLVRKISETIGVTAERSKIKVGLILSLKRDDDLDLSAKIADLAKKLYKSHVIVGLDLAGNEHFFPNEQFYILARKVKKAQIPFIVHAGEVTDPRSVETAVKKLGADRISHGVKAADNPRVLELLAKRKILLEVCPTSNIQTGAYESYDQVPIRKLLEYQVPILICTDDPVTSDITLSSEIANLIERKIISFKEYRSMLSAAKAHYFLDDK